MNKTRRNGVCRQRVVFSSFDALSTYLRSKKDSISSLGFSEERQRERMEEIVSAEKERRKRKKESKANRKRERANFLPSAHHATFRLKKGGREGG